MKLLLKVDQAAALRAGVDAPDSTVMLDVQPSEFTVRERELLAAVMVEGYDCTVRGICRDVEGDEITAPPWNERDRRQHRNGDPTDPLRLEAPDVAGLHDAIDRLLSERDAYRQAKHEKVERLRQEADERIRKCLAEPLRTETVNVRRGTDGRPVIDNWSTYKPSVGVTVPIPPSVYSCRHASPEMRNAYDVRRAEVSAERDRLIAAADPELAAVEARIEAAQAAERAEYDALYARLPDGLRERHEAGYATDDEVDAAIRRLIRRDAGYGGYAGWADSRELSSLTDEEFATLKRIRAEAPEGAVVEAREVWDCDDCDEDDYDEDDHDDPKRTNIRRVAVVRWTRGGVQTKAVVPLG